MNNNLRGGGCGQAKPAYQRPAAKMIIKSDLPPSLLSMTQAKVDNLKSKILTIADKAVQDEYLQTINWLDTNEYWYQRIPDDEGKMGQCIKLLQFILLDVLEIVGEILDGSRFIAYSLIRVANAFSRIMVVYYTLNKDTFLDLELSNNLKEKINSIKEMIKSYGETSLYYNGLQYESGITEACINICPVDNPEGKELGLNLLVEIVKSAASMSPSDDLFSTLGDFVVFGLKALYQKYKEMNFKEMMTKCLFIEQLKWSVVTCVEKETYQINSIFKTLAKFYKNEVQNSKCWQVKYCWIKATHWIMGYRLIITQEMLNRQKLDTFDSFWHELIAQQIIQIIDKSDQSMGAIVNENVNLDLSATNPIYVDLMVNIRTINRIKNKLLNGSENLPHILQDQSNNTDQQNANNQKMIEVQNQLEYLGLGNILDKFEYIQLLLNNLFIYLTDLSELVTEFNYETVDQYLVEDICQQSKLIPLRLQELNGRIIALKISLIQFGQAADNFLNIISQDEQLKKCYDELNEDINLQFIISALSGAITEYQSSKSNNKELDQQYQESCIEYIKKIHQQIDGKQIQNKDKKDKILKKLLQLLESLNKNTNVTSQINDLLKISHESKNASKYKKLIDIIEVTVFLQSSKASNIDKYLNEVQLLNILYSKLSFVPLQFINEFKDDSKQKITYNGLISIKLELDGSQKPFKHIKELFEKILINKSSLNDLYSQLDKNSQILQPGLEQNTKILDEVVSLKYNNLDLSKIDIQNNQLKLQTSQPFQQMEGIIDVQKSFIQQYEIQIEQYQKLIQNILSLDQVQEDHKKDDLLQTLKSTLMQTQHKIQGVQDSQIKFLKQYEDSLKQFKELFDTILTKDQAYQQQFQKVNEQLELKSWNVKMMNEELFKKIVLPENQPIDLKQVQIFDNRDSFKKDIMTILKLINSYLDQERINTIKKLLTPEMLSIKKCSLSDQIIKELISKFSSFNNTDSKDLIQISILSVTIIDNIKLIKDNAVQDQSDQQEIQASNKQENANKLAQVIDINFIGKLSNYKENHTLYSNSLRQIIKYNKTGYKNEQQTFSNSQLENVEYLIDLINTNFQQIVSLQFMNQNINDYQKIIKDKLSLVQQLSQSQIKQCLEQNENQAISFDSNKQSDGDQWRYRECQLFYILITQQRLISQYQQEYEKELIKFKALETDSRIQKIFKSSDFLLQQQNALERHWKQESSSIQMQISAQLIKLQQLQKQIQSQQPGEDRDQLLRDHSALEAQVNDQIENVSGIGSALGITIAFIQDLKKELFIIQDQLKELNSKLSDMSMDIKFLIGKTPQQLLEIRMEKILKQKTIDDARSVYVQLYTLEMQDFDKKKESEKPSPLFNSGEEYDGEIDEFIRTSKQSSLLVHGPAGSGKSTAAKKVEEHLWIRYKQQQIKNWNEAKEKPIIPIFIQLPTLKDPKFKALQETLKSTAYLFNDKQIADLQTFVQDGKVRLFIIMDSYDELSKYYIEQQLNITNKFEQWCEGANYQVLNTTRSEILTNKTECRSWFASTTKKITNDNFKEIRILPFKKDQRTNFYTQYCKLSLKQAIIDIYDILFDQTNTKIDTALIINDLWEQINEVVNTSASTEDKLLDQAQINSIIQLIKAQKTNKIDLYKDQETHLRSQLSQLWSFNMYVQNIDRLKITHLVETPYMTNIVLSVLPQLIESFSSQDHLKIVFIRNMEVRQTEKKDFSLIQLKSNEIWDLLIESKSLIDYKITDNRISSNIISQILKQIDSIIAKNFEGIRQNNEQEFYLRLRKFIKNYFDSKQQDYNIKLLTTILKSYQDLLQDVTLRSLFQILLDNEIIFHCIQQNQPTSYDFYQMFLSEFVKKQINKLAYKQQNIQIRKYFQDAYEYLQYLGTLMTTNQLTQIEYHQKGIIDKKSEGDLQDQIYLLFDDNAKHSTIKAQIRTSIPLKIRGDSYSFFHKSIQEYLFAKSFIDLLDIMKPLQELKIQQLFEYRMNQNYGQWNYSELQSYDHYRKSIINPEDKLKIEQIKQLIKLLLYLDKHFINEKIYSEDFFIGSINFMVNKIKQNSELISIIMILVKISKLGSNFQNCSSNCFHIIQRAQLPLYGTDLSGIYLNKISIRNVNLRQANLSYSKFTKVDIDGINLTNANLSYCKWQKIITNELPLMKVNSIVFSLTYSKDGTRLITGSEDGIIRIWDPLSGKQIGKNLTGHTHIVRSVAISPDGKLIASSSGHKDKTVRIWDAQSCQQIGESLSGHSSGINSVCFSPDGMFIASGSDDKSVRIWDVQSHKQIGQSLIHAGDVSTVQYSPNGVFIASTSNLCTQEFYGDATYPVYDSRIKIWDSQSRQLIGDLIGHSNDIQSLSFSPDSKFVASGSDDQTVRLWDLMSRKQIGESMTGHNDQVRCVQFSPDGKFIASGGGGRDIRIWDPLSQKQIGESLTGHQGLIHSISYSPNGKLIASGSEDKTARIWDSQFGKQIGENLVGHTGTINSVTYSPDGKFIASGSADGSIIIWDSQSGLQSGEKMYARVEEITSIAYSPDGKLIVSGNDWCFIRIWDVQSRMQIGETIKLTRIIKQVSFSPDGKFIVSASQEETIRIWDAQTGKIYKELMNKMSSTIYSVQFSPNGKFIAAGCGDKSVRIWDIESGKHSTLNGHQSYVNSVTYSPDGKFIASSGSEDKSIRIWDVESQKQVGQPLLGHSKDITSVQFSPDGKFIASGSKDYTIRIWEVTTRQQFGDPLNGHINMVHSIAYSPDGKFIVSGSQDKCLRIWDAQSSKLIQEIRSGIPDEEKINYVSKERLQQSLGITSRAQIQQSSNQLIQRNDSCVLRIPNSGHILYQGCNAYGSQIQSRIAINVLQLWTNRQNQID